MVRVLQFVEPRFSGAAIRAMTGRLIHAIHAIMCARAKIGVLIYATTPMLRFRLVIQIFIHATI